MQITFNQESGRYVADSSFEERHIPKAARWRWDPTTKKWWTDRDENAARLAEYADATCAERLRELAQAHTEAIEASRATDANIELPCPDGLAYLPYQRAGIAYGLSHNDVLIGDEMGLGKTIQAIGILNTDATLNKVMVICPATLKLNWKNELNKWLTRRLTPAVASGKEWPAGADIVIINYDILSKFSAEIRAHEWDAIIVDEAHFLKNPKTLRTTQVYGKWDKDPEKKIEPIKARRRIFLTGTPICNRPIEMWPMLQATKIFTNWRYFVKRYCNGYKDRYGWKVNGSSNLDELQETLRSNLMIRRLKKDVLTELPPKVRQVIEVDANGAAGVVAREREEWERHQEIIENLQAEVELAKAGTKEEYEAAVLRLRKCQQVAFTEMAAIRHEVALAKVPKVIEHLESCLEEGKIVCFAHHKDVVKAIKDHFGPAAVVLVGDTPMAERQAAVEAFQGNDAIRLFIGSIAAAGVGITLTAASHVVFAELDWVPGNVSQAEDRCHRIGQTDSVLVQHLVIDGSIDAKMAHTIVAKQRVIDAALDKEHANKVEQAQEIASADEKKAATKRLQRERVEKEAEKMPLDQRVAILACLKILSGMCDGARELDNAGFSKIDVRIGHELAREHTITAKQAVLGKRLCIKYHRQLPAELLAAAKGIYAEEEDVQW